MNALAVKAYDLRQDVLDIIVSGGGGHIGGDMSCMEIVLALYNRMNVSPDRADDPNRDRFVLSKGTAWRRSTPCWPTGAFWTSMK